jgi:hypothetical protein
MPHSPFGPASHHLENGLSFKSAEMRRAIMPRFTVVRKILVAQRVLI